MDKRGQVYLLAALLLGIIIFGLVVELNKVNRFNIALIMVFYFGVLGEVFSSKDIEMSKKIFEV